VLVVVEFLAAVEKVEEEAVVVVRTSVDVAVTEATVLIGRADVEGRAEAAPPVKAIGPQ